MNGKTYITFFFNNKFNWILVPLTIILFILSEVILALFLRLLAEYESVVEGNSYIFRGSLSSFWPFLTLLTLAYTVVLIVELFLLNLCIINSSSTAH